MPEFPYEDYVQFFSTWFGNVYFITLAFLLWVGITWHWVFMLKGRTLWLRVSLALVVSAIHYLVFGLLIAGGRMGGEAEFLYDPAHLSENLLVHGGLIQILLWPLSLLPTGGYLMVLPVIIAGWVFWYLRRRKKEAGGKQRGQA
jgi:hypothetical protein